MGGRKFKTSQGTLLTQDFLLSKLIKEDLPKDDSKVYFVHSILWLGQVESEFYKLRGLTQAVERIILKVALPKNDYYMLNVIISWYVIKQFFLYRFMFK